MDRLKAWWAKPLVRSAWYYYAVMLLVSLVLGQVVSFLITGDLLWSLAWVVGVIAMFAGWLFAVKRNSSVPRHRFANGGFTGDSKADELAGTVHPAQTYCGDVARALFLRHSGYTGRLFYWSDRHDDWRELS